MSKLDISLLIVEDDPIILRIYHQILGEIVEKVYLAEDGQKGFESYLTIKPDLILTDIKMPVMNGLDMVKKINEEDKSQRVIVMSAYGESRYYLKAIESGVNGFLLKPINNDLLINTIKGQANDILLERNYHIEEERRRNAERARDKSERILQTLSLVTASFFRSGFNEQTVRYALKHIGQATYASRVYIFRNFEEKGQAYTRQLFEWTAEGVSSEFENELLSKLPFSHPSFTRWVSVMTNGNNIVGNVRDFPDVERQVLEEQGVISILAIPIFVHDRWWGFVGLDECNTEREWSDAEINALNALAYNLGAAVYRKNAEEEMILLNEGLERRVRERTKELELEVAERTLAESLYKDSEEKYRVIFENATDGILLIQNNTITLVNPSMIELLEQSPREVLGSKLSKFIDQKYEKYVVKYFESKTESFTGKHIVLQLLTTNGRWLEIKTTNIIWDYSPAYLLFASDITKRVAAEIDLKELNKHLEKRIRDEVSQVEKQQQLLIQKSKLESIGELSAGLAHEINQPLVGISMGLENIIHKKLGGTLSVDYIENKIDLLFKDVDRIKSIIEHVRIFSRDQQNTSKEKININKVISDALSMIERQLTNNQIQLGLELHPDILHTTGNPYKLEQVLLNLISNSRFAIEEKNKRISGKFAKRILITSYKKDNEAIIEVIDNGIGIPSQFIHNIFDPFFTTKSAEKGTGLGLSITYGIIDEMNGQIQVDSVENEYTKMIIHLPLLENEL